MEWIRIVLSADEDSRTFPLGKNRVQRISPTWPLRLTTSCFSTPMEEVISDSDVSVVDWTLRYPSGPPYAICAVEGEMERALMLSGAEMAALLEGGVRVCRGNRRIVGFILRDGHSTMKVV